MLPKIKKFTDLEVWKQTHQLTLQIYKLTADFPELEKFGLVSQLRRAIVSVESCIAEGFSRYHYKERLKFYFDSRGSLSEVECQILIAYDLKYISKIECETIISKIEKISIILNGLINATNQRIESI